MRRRTVLTIEDVAEVRMLLAMALERRYKVLVASGGEEGLRLFREQKVNLRALAHF